MISEETAQRFMNLFRGREGYFGRFTPSEYQTGVKIEGKASTVAGTLRIEDIEAHLNGGQGVGIIPIMNSNRCVFGAIDIDDYATDFDDLREKIIVLELPLIICKSKSGGAHLYVFLQEEQKACDVQDVLKRFAASLGVSTIIGANGEPRPVEIFPKQRFLDYSSGNKSMGSFINLPYYGGTRFAIDGEGLEMSLETFLEFAESIALDKKVFEDWKKPRVEKIDQVDENCDFYEGPPCVAQLILAGKGVIGKGERNDGLFALATMLKKQHGGEWTQYLDDINQKYISPPLERKEVDVIIESHNKSSYNYRCNSLMLGQYCDKATCKTRKYGVSDIDTGVEMGDLIIVDSEPRTYFWTINGTQVQFDVDDFYSARDFYKKVYERTGIVITKDNMDQQKLLEWLKKKTADAKHVSVEYAMTPQGMLFYHLITYLKQNCLKKVRNETDLWNGISMGATYYDDQVKLWYFKLPAFVSYLSTIGFNELKPMQVRNLINDVLKARTKVKNIYILSTTLRYWELDGDLVDYHCIQKNNEGENGNV